MWGRAASWRHHIPFFVLFGIPPKSDNQTFAFYLAFYLA
jgi:hypothetical protein